MTKSLLRTDKEIEEIYIRHVDTLFRVCFTYLKNSVDAEDAVQNTFIKLINYKGIFQNKEHEKAWLIVTSSNICKDFLKHWWRKREDITNHENANSVPEFEVDETLEAVMKLPSRYKTAVYLYYYEGYSCVEIAKMLNKPQSTIRNHLHEARKILNKRLGGDVIEE